jgi:hypothetical protein
MAKFQNWEQIEEGTDERKQFVPMKKDKSFKEKKWRGNRGARGDKRDKFGGWK